MNKNKLFAVIAKFIALTFALSLLVIPNQAQAAAKVGVVGSVTFSATGTTLSTTSKRTLDGWVNYLKLASAIKVTGYQANKTGPTTVASNRAKAVVTYLQSKGVKAGFSSATAVGVSPRAVIAITKVASATPTPTPTKTATPTPTPTPTGSVDLFVKIDGSIVGACTSAQVALNVGGATGYKLLATVSDPMGGMMGGGITSWCQGTVSVTGVPVGTHTPELTLTWPGAPQPFTVSGNGWNMTTTTSNTTHLVSKSTVTVTKDQKTTMSQLLMNNGNENPSALKPDPSFSANAGNTAIEVQLDPTLIGSNDCWSFGAQFILTWDVVAFKSTSAKTIDGKKYCVATLNVNQMPAGSYDASVDITFLTTIAGQVSAMKTTNADWTAGTAASYYKKFTKKTKVVIAKTATTTIPTLVITK